MPPTPAPEAAVAIEHDGERFVARVEGFDGVDARLDYRREGLRMVITHTLVPESIGGQGIADRLTRAAFEHARIQGWKVQPACAFAGGWAQRHPEYRALLA